MNSRKPAITHKPEVVVLGDSESDSDTTVRDDRRSRAPSPPEIQSAALPFRAVSLPINVASSSAVIPRRSNPSSGTARTTPYHSIANATTPAAPRKCARERDDMIDNPIPKSRPNRALIMPEVIDLEELEGAGRPENGVQDDAEVIDLDALEQQFEEEFAREQAQSLPQNRAAHDATTYTRNPPLAFPWRGVQTIHHNDMSLKPGKTVELQNGTFLYIINIIKNPFSGLAKLRGWLLKRCTDMRGLLPKSLNELCYVHEVLYDDPRSMLEQSVIEIGLGEVAKIRLLIRTNWPFPAHRPNFQSISKDMEENKRNARENERLVVRWKYITYYDNAQEQAQNPAFQGNIRKREMLPLEEEECSSPDHYLPADVHRVEWRKDVIGSQKAPMSHLEHRCQYTFGDAYCGAGGATRGAKDAGLDITWGLDCDSNTALTWRRNFPFAEHYELWTHEFIALPSDISQFLVDILHLSPPCQVFSPMHTHRGKNDDQNFNSLFACQELIKKSKPRIITLEQTFGILHPRFQHPFHSLLQMFTSEGCAVSWQTVEFPKYGLAQSRRRLIILAAAPGETLPNLPAYTHSNNPSDNLKPYNSVRNVLSRIPHNAENHDIEAATRRGSRKSPWDDSGITTCITTDGGSKGHPSGLRDLTERERASLQSFPLVHVFLGTYRNKQIGNAVPPSIAKIIFKAVKKHLEKSDGIERDIMVLE